MAKTLSHHLLEKKFYNVNDVKKALDNLIRSIFDKNEKIYTEQDFLEFLS